MSTRKLENIIRPLREIESVGIIRLGSKMPAFSPYRFINDPELLEMLAQFSTPEKRIYVMAHFNVPNELTDVALEGLDLLKQAGVVTVNQSPILKGINDDVEVLAELMRKLSIIGVPPYYFFQCRPTEGNKPYEIPMVQTFELLEEAKRQVSGLARRARLVMSHELRKVEMVGLTDRYIYLRFHRARNSEDEGRFMVFHRDDDAYWLEDLVPVNEEMLPPSVQDLERGSLKPVEVIERN